MATTLNSDRGCSVKCEICGANSPKYKCPKCLLKTCSLPCVKKHKTDKDCTGVRDKTAYISIKNFSDLNVLSDYRFLEDAGRKAESAHRDPNNRRHHLPVKVQKLTQACTKREIIFKPMPPSFTKRKENTSYYHIAADEISWHVEWVFPQAGIKHSESVSENKPFHEIAAGFFDPNKASPALYHSLKTYRKEQSTKGLGYLMKVEKRPANSVRYYKFEQMQCLKTALKGKLIIEYPSIYIVLGEAAKEYRLLGEESDSEDSSSDSEDSESSESSSSDSEAEEVAKKKDSQSSQEPPWNKLLNPNFGK